MKRLVLKIIPALIFVCLTIFTSCNKDRAKNSDIFTLDSEVNQGILIMRGFRFETLKIINYPNSTNQKPDFIVTAYTDITGELLAPYISSFRLRQ